MRPFGPGRVLAASIYGLLAVVIGLGVSGAVAPRVSPSSPSRNSAAVPWAADSAAVAETVHRFHRALATGDSAAALALLAPDVAILESGGAERLAEYRAHHLPGDIAFLRAVRSETGSVRVVLQGDAAWASSVSRTDGEYRGRQLSLAGAELMVLSRMAGGWGIRAIHWSSRPHRTGH